MFPNLKMTTILGKSIKIKFLNFRLPLSTLKLNYHVHQFRPHRLKVNGEMRFATAAFKYPVNEERSGGRRNAQKFNINTVMNSSPENVESALSKIDFIAKRSGRILMKHVVNALNVINGKEINSSIHGLYLLRSCKYVLNEPSAKQSELANQIWNRCQELGIEFDVRHYNALLEAHILNSFAFNPSDMLSSMEEGHITPNKTTCVLLIDKYCKDGNLGGASEILEYMKEKGFPANEEVFNHLIEGHLKNNDFTGAKDMIEVMNASNLKPTEDTYTLFACAFAACGDKGQMIPNLKGEHTNVSMSAKNYLKVIEALAVSGNHQYIDDVLNLMENIQENRQEFINASIELIHKDCVDAAYKLVISSADSQYNQGTNIFIKQLIKVQAPVSQILHYSKDILSKGINQVIILNATNAAIEFGNIDCAFSLFKETLALGYPIRTSHFIPIFSYLKDTKATKDIWVVLEKMCELGVPADFTLYLDHIFPAMGVPNLVDITQNVQKSDQIAQIAYDALFVYYCNLGEIDHAFTLAQSVPISVSSKLDFNSFLNRYEEFSSSQWKNISSKYFKVLKYILKNVELLGRQYDAELLKGKYLAHLILTKPRLFEALLRSENLSFSKEALYACENYLNKKNPSSLIFLQKLKVGSSENKFGMTIQEENSHLEYLKDHDLPCKSFLTERIFHHLKSRNIDRVSDLLSVYEKNDFSYTPLMLTQLITLFSIAADLKKAKEVFSKLKNDFPSFKLDVGKVFDYAALLTKYAEFDEALAVLKHGSTEPCMISNTSHALRSIRRFTTAASETENVEFIRSAQNLMMPLSKSVGSEEIFLEPLVTVHLSRKDLASAFDEYRNILIKYRTAAGLHKILKTCLNAGDKMTLQKVVDVTINYVGRNVALLELSLALVESGHYDKAATVIQNLGSEADPLAIEEICTKLSNQNKLVELDQFIQATKSLTHIDKEKQYFHLLQACANRNDYSKAIEVFDRMKEEVAEPSSQTVDCLVNLLKRNNQPVPTSLASKSTSEFDASASSLELSRATENFMKHLEERNAELALCELNELKKGYIRSLSSKCMTDLVDVCLEKNCIKDLSTNVQAMSYIIENSKEILRPVLEKYSTAGEVEKLRAVANYFPDFSIKKIGFNTFFAKSFISNGKHEDLLSELEERCEKKSKLFSVAAFEELLKFPQFEDRLLKLSQKYLDSNFDLPFAVIWAHHFMKEDYQKADEIISKLKSFNVDSGINSRILRMVREDENVSLGRRYVDFITPLNVRQRVKTAAYGTLLDVMVLKEKYDDAVDLVLESEKLQLLLHTHFHTTLVTLKSALESANKPVPFSIPNKDLVSNTSSDSE